MKANLFHHLPSMFPDHPGWLDHHISGAGRTSQIVENEAGLSRFTDSLIGQTSMVRARPKDQSLRGWSSPGQRAPGGIA